MVRFALGVTLAIGLHLLLGGWWLDDGRRVVVTLATVLVATAFMASTPRSAAQVWTGIAGGMTVILFAIGAGTIFPIVIVIGSGLLAVAAVLGLGVRLALSEVFPTRAGR